MAGSPSRSVLVTAFTAVRFALRELKGGLQGFRIFLAVIALGVATITSVGSVSDGLVRGLGEEGQVILGGDLRITQEALPLKTEELSRLEALGQVTALRYLRTIARPASDPDTTAYVGLKAVDDAFPLAGELEIDPPQSVASAIESRQGVYGLVIEPIMALRYDLGVGDLLSLGQEKFEIRGLIKREPDRALSGVNFASRVILSQAALETTGLIRPGSLVDHHYRILLPPATTDAEVETLVGAFREEAKQKGWGVRSRLQASPGLESNIKRFGQFLTLVGLATLIIGGVGVSNAIQVFVHRKARNVAILGSLGADDGLIIGTYLIQVMVLTLLAIAIGVGVGTIVTFLGGEAVAGALGVKVPISPGIIPALQASAYGVLISLCFVFPPLSRMRAVKPSALLRDRVAPSGGFPSVLSLAVSTAALLGLIAMAFFTAEDPRVSLYMIGGTFIAFFGLLGIAKVIIWLARKSPRPKNQRLRFALSNIHRPDSMTASVILSLGIGISLLVTLAEVEGNLRLRLSDQLPEGAPSFFFQNIDREQSDSFDQALKVSAPEGEVKTVPMLRGRIITLGGANLEASELPPELSWLRGDRGITYADQLPEDATLARGEWWPAGYQGEPLVSITDDVAEGFNLKIGDEVTVNVLGRNISAKIGNTRAVVWESLSINFVLVFSPNAFTGAPHTMLKTLALPEGAGSAEEAGILRKILKAYPEVTAVRVKDALALALSVAERLADAIRIAAIVAVLASILVLAGALAASSERRIYDAVVLKVLGAERRWLMGAYLLEFFILGLVVSGFAALAGTLAAYFLLEEIIGLGFVFQSGPIVVTLIVSVGLTIIFGLSSAFRALSASPAQKLRAI